MNSTEKRRARRFRMQLPVVVQADEDGTSEHVVQTRDVSSSGVYFEFEKELSMGSHVEFLLTLPEPITKGTPVRIKCMGKVVRVEHEGDGHNSQVGIAATIERYEFIREN